MARGTVAVDRIAVGGWGVRMAAGRTRGPYPLGMRFWAVWVAWGLAAVAGARAQETEYRLDASGEWKRAEAAPRNADEAVIAKAREQLANDQPGKARRTLRDWIEANRKSESPLLPQAYVLRGDARTADRDEYEALYDYETVCIEYPGTEEFVKAVERELEIAIRYVNGYRRKFLGLRINAAGDVGEELLVRVQERLPQSRVAERAGIELADYYYRNRELALASLAYDLFVQNFPRSRFADRARVQRIFAEIGRYKGPEYDGSGLADAKVLIQDYAQVNPINAQREGLTDALLSRLDESSAEQLLVRAKWYLRRNDPVSARATLRRLVAAYPRTLAAEAGMEILDKNEWTYAKAATTPMAPPPTPAPPAPGGAAAPGENRDGAR